MSKINKTNTVCYYCMIDLHNNCRIHLLGTPRRKCECWCRTKTIKKPNKTNMEQKNINLGIQLTGDN